MSAKGWCLKGKVDNVVFASGGTMTQCLPNDGV